MGKPYASELNMLKGTYHWALNEPIDSLNTFIEASYDLPLLALGSGGSQTAACLAALLHETNGMISKAITPLELVASNISLAKTSVLFLTAGGRNLDILTSFKYAAAMEPRELMVLCTRSNSPLADLAKNYNYVMSTELDIPSGKDGFLATNSLLALATILCRSYRNVGSYHFELPNDSLFELDLYNNSNNLIHLMTRRTWFVLYGGWCLPAAMDLESKFTEAALGNIHLADYRNFAHGRHNWLAQCREDTGIICLTTPEEKKIADQTLKLIPEDIPSICISTSSCGPAGALELLVKVLYFINTAGEARRIDPGKPNVPEFGRKIYHMNFKSFYAKNKMLLNVQDNEFIAIRRKNLGRYVFEEDLLAEWKKAYQLFIKRIECTNFGAVVFDYDGTLCDSHERLAGPSKAVVENLICLLENKTLIGIATGRGKSIRNDLQKRIPKGCWNKVLIGYYNGSDIALLDDMQSPKKDMLPDQILCDIANKIESNEIIRDLIAELELRPKQITIIPKTLCKYSKIRNMLFGLLPRDLLTNIKVLESSHSIDLVLSNVSKLDLVSAIEEMAGNLGRPKNTICIGDKGEWPGNDYELLSTKCSLSVDCVSSDPNSCWNLAPAGHRGVQAVLDYMQSVVISKKSLKIDTKHIGWEKE